VPCSNPSRKIRSAGVCYNRRMPQNKTSTNKRISGE
jgi:hypothetical protein